MIERSTLEREDFILVPETKQALHLVGVHGALTKQSEDGDFPDSKFRCHIAHMNYIK